MAQLAWNSTQGRYESEIEVDGQRKLLCVDGDEFAEARQDYEKETGKTADEAYAELIETHNWDHLVGENDRVWLEDI
jgi:hypothetical protein